MLNIFCYICCRPLTLSENLAKIAQKIDFSKTNGDEVNKEQPEGGEKSEEDQKDSASFQSSLWPWDSIRNKLRFVILYYLLNYIHNMIVCNIFNNTSLRILLYICQQISQLEE